MTDHIITQNLMPNRWITISVPLIGKEYGWDY